MAGLTYVGPAFFYRGLCFIALLRATGYGTLPFRLAGTAGAAVWVETNPSPNNPYPGVLSNPRFV